MASDQYGGRELLINSQPVRGKLLLVSDQGADVFTAVNQQRWTLSVPYLSWLALGLEFPQAQSQLAVDGAELPAGFAAERYEVVEVIGLDPNVNLVLQKNI